MSLLQTVIDIKIANCSSRSSKDNYLALCDIKDLIDMFGPYYFADSYSVLVNNSAEEFMIEFMTKYNEVVSHYY